MKQEHLREPSSDLCALVETTAAMMISVPMTASQQQTGMSSCSIERLEKNDRTDFSPLVHQSAFTTVACSNSTLIGPSCNISIAWCDFVHPCENNGTCQSTKNNSRGYLCSCPSGFDGTECQFDRRPCQPETCWNGGICNETSNQTFRCGCSAGWERDQCEIKVNYCANATCQNQGICRPLLGDYRCECLGSSYSGRQCETVSKETVVLQTISTSFASVAIIAMSSVAMFVIGLDLLKYRFGIDPAKEEINRKPIIAFDTFTFPVRHLRWSRKEGECEN